MAPAGWGECSAYRNCSAEVSRAEVPAPPAASPRGGEVPQPGQNSGPFPLHPGLFCNRTFDDYACWPDGPPGSFVNVSCPWYLPWANSGESPPPHMDHPSRVQEAGGQGWSWSGVHTVSFPLGHSLPHPRGPLGLLMGVCGGKGQWGGASAVMWA